MTHPSGQIQQHYLQQFELIREVHDSLAAIIAVAEHLTPVEDLLDFQTQISLIYDNLAVLVAASTIIAAATDAGKDMLVAADVPAQRVLLELDTAALRPEEYFATASSVQALTTALAALTSELAAAVVLLNQKLDTVTYVAGQAVQDERLDLLESQMDNVGTSILLLEEEGTGMAMAMQTLTARVTVTENGIDAIAQFTTILQTQVTNLETGQSGLSTAFQQLTSRVTTNENSITAMASFVTDLQVDVSSLQAGLTLQGTAIAGLETRVTDNEFGQTLLSTQYADLANRMIDAESGLEVQAVAHTALTTRVTATEDSLLIMAEDVTTLSASLGGVSNELPNAGFETDASGWEIYSRGAGWATAVLSRDLDGAVPPATHALSLTPTSGVPGGAVGVRVPSIPCQNGERFILSAYMAAVNCTATLEWRFLNANGDLLEAGIAATTALPITVNYATFNGTAFAGVDYTNTSGILTFAPGDLVKTFTIPIANGAGTVATNKAFTVKLSGASHAVTVRDTATVTIADNENLLKLNISNTCAFEGDNAVFTISLSSIAGGDVTFRVNTANGTALAGTHYTTQTNVLVTIPAGQTSTTYSVPTTENAVSGDGGKTFTLTMSSPSGATIVTAAGTATIYDDDGARHLIIRDVLVNEAAGTATVTVMMSKTGYQVAGTVLGNWERQHKSLLAPMDAAQLQTQWWLANAHTGTPKAWLLMPMLERSIVGQLNPSPWTIGASGIDTKFANAVSQLSVRIDETEDLIDLQAGALTALSVGLETVKAQGMTVTGKPNGMAEWTIVAVGTGVEVSYPTDAAAMGGYVMRLGNNSGADTVSARFSHTIPFDATKLYRIRYRYRRVSGSGSMYLGLSGLDADRSQYVTTANTLTSNLGSSHYFVSNATPTLGSWVEGIYYFKGRSAGASTGTGTIVDPRTVSALVSHVTPMFLANNTGVAGEQEIDYIVIEDADAEIKATANASAISSLDTRVTATESTIVAHATDLTELEVSLVASLPGTFELGTKYFTNARVGDPALQADVVGTLVQDSVLGRALEITDFNAVGENVLQKGVVLAASSKAYKVTARFRASVLPADSNYQMSLIVQGMNDAYVATSALNSPMSAIIADTGEVVLTAIYGLTATNGATHAWPAGSRYLRFGLRLNSAETGLVIRVGELRVEEAFAQAGNASAISALDARVVVAEGTLVSQATAVTALTSEVGDVREISEIGSGIIINPNFSNWGGSEPNGWALEAGVLSKETATVRTRPNAVKFASTGTSAAGLLASNSTALANLPINIQYVTVEADWMLTSGALTGAQVLLDWFGMGGTNRAVLDLPTEVPAVVLNKWYRTTKVLKRPAAATGTQTGWRTYLMANFGTLTNKTIIFDRYQVRPSSAEEISAYESVSGISANASALSALDTRVTSAEGTLTSQASSITTLNATVAPIGGNGANLLWSEFCHQELAMASITGSTFPAMSVANGTVASIADAACPSGFALRFTTSSNSTTAHVRFSPDATTTKNLSLVGGRKYRMSFYAKSTTSGHQIRPFMRGSASGTSLDGTVITLTTSYARYTQDFDLTAVASGTGHIAVFTNISGVASRLVDIDRVMLEAVIGPNTGASNYVAGPSSKQTANSATATQALEVRVTSAEGEITTLESKWSITLDVNGYISGLNSVNNGTQADITFLADNVYFIAPGVTKKRLLAIDATGLKLANDLYMGAGRIISDTGTYMKVQGTGFGTSNQFVEWYGPKMAINLCSYANAIYYLTTNGDAYFGGTLSAGTLKNAVHTTTTVMVGTYIINGPFLTNGEDKLVVISFSRTSVYTSAAHGVGGFSSSGSNTATVEIYRKIGTAAETLWHTMNVTGSVEIENDTDGPDGCTSSWAGSVTMTDSDASTADRTYRAIITAQTTATISHGGTIDSSSTVQRLSIISTEEP